MRGPYQSASAHVVTSMHRSGYYRLERQLPGGIRTRKESAPFHGARKEIVQVQLGLHDLRHLPFDDI